MVTAMVCAQVDGIKGVVDANDLPLNVSREMLQSNRTIESIKSGCVKKILSMLESLAKKDAEKYQSFWKEFGQVLKEGVAEAEANDIKSKLEAAGPTVELK